VTEQTQQRTRPTGSTLAIGDGLVLIVFVIIGLLNHEKGITAAGLARTALPLLGAWFVVSALDGNYREPGTKRLVLTWAIAVPVAVTIRALILHHTVISKQISFGIVALVITLAFLLSWRLVLKLIRG